MKFPPSPPSFQSCFLNSSLHFLQYLTHDDPYYANSGIWSSVSFPSFCYVVYFCLDFWSVSLAYYTMHKDQDCHSADSL